MKSYFVASVVIAMSFAAMAYETNTWQGQSGGKWGDSANWSLERVPSADDYTVFPDVGLRTPLKLMVTMRFIPSIWMKEKILPTRER